MILTTYFTDDTGEQLELLMENNEYRLNFEDSTVVNVLREEQAEWIADNLLHAVNISKYTLSQVLTLIITGTWESLKELENFDQGILKPIHTYVNVFEL